MEIFTPEDKEDSVTISIDLDTSMLRDVTQNDPQVFDMVENLDSPFKNIEEEAMYRGELHCSLFREIFQTLLSLTEFFFIFHFPKSTI